MKLEKFKIRYSMVGGDLFNVNVIDTINELSKTLSVLLPIGQRARFEKMISDIPKEDKNFEIDLFCDILSGAISFSHK